MKPVSSREKPFKKHGGKREASRCRSFSGGSAAKGATARRMALPLGMALVLAGAPTAQAAGGTWTNTAGGSWATTTNWSGGAVAGGSGYTADFSTLNLTANATVTLDGARTIGYMVFGDTTASHNWTVATGTGGPLTLAGSQAPLQIWVNTPTTATISAVLAGTQGLQLAGGGTLILGAINTYTGTTEVSWGTLQLTANSGSSGTLRSSSLIVRGNSTILATVGNALGYSGSNWVRTLVVDGGTFTTTANGDQGWGLGIQLTGGTLNATGTGARFAAGGGTSFYAAPSAVSSVINGEIRLREGNTNNRVVFEAWPGTAAAALVVNGAITEKVAGYGIEKTGTGVMQIAGTCSYTGSTTVSAGTLLVTGTLANTVMSVAGGATLSGTGTLGGGVTVNGTLSPGNASVATLTINNYLTLAAGSTTQMVIGKTGATLRGDRVSGISGLTLGGTLDVTIEAGSAPLALGDTFTLFSAVTRSGAFASVNLPDLPAGLAWDQSKLATDGTLRVISGPSLPVVTTQAADGVSDLDATLRGTIDARGGFFDAWFEYGLTSSYGTKISSTPAFATGSAAVALSRAVGGLRPSSTYHYRLVAYNSLNGQSYPGSDATFTTAAAGTAPRIGEGLAVTAITATSARLQAFGIFAGSSTASVRFDYGPDAGYGQVGNASPVGLGLTANRSVDLTGLEPGRTYHFRCRATNIQGVALSEDATFTTDPLAVVANSALGAVTDHGASVQAEVEVFGPECSVYLEYGPTTGYGAIIDLTPDRVPAGGPVPVAGVLTGLPAGTAFHCRVSVSLPGSDLTWSGPDLAFTTQPAAGPPVFLTAPRAGSANLFEPSLLSGLVKAGAAPATVTFEFGPTTAYGSPLAGGEVPAGASREFTVSPAGLAPATTYHFRCTAASAVGSTASEDITFTTSAAPLATGPATEITDRSALIHGTVGERIPDLNLNFQIEGGGAYWAPVGVDGLTGSETTPFAVSKVLSGLQPETTYRYRLAYTSSVSGRLVAAEEGTFTTTATASPPRFLDAPAPQDLSFDQARMGAGRILAGSSAATVVLDYGPTPAYGSRIALASNLTAGSLSSPTLLVSGLAPLTTYHYRWQAGNSSGTATTPDSTFTTLAAPVVTTSPPTDLTDIAAVLHGSCATGGGGYTLSFEAGPTTAYGTTIAPTQTGAGPGPGEWLAEASWKPVPGTTYHHRLVAREIWTNRTFPSNDVVFTTPAAATPPQASTLAATVIGPEWVVLEAGGLAAGGAVASISYEWGPTTAYGSTVASGSFPVGGGGSDNTTLTGLLPGQTYHARCKITSVLGTAFSADLAFTTTTLPLALTLAPSSVEDMGATLEGVVNTRGPTMVVAFEYGRTTAYGRSEPAFAASIGQYTYLASASPVPVQAWIDHLLPATTYHVRLVATDQSTSTTYVGEDVTFTTAAAATPPRLGGLQASVASQSAASLWVNVTDTGSSATTATFEYGTSTAYGLIATSATVLPADSNGSAGVTLNGLASDTTYHFRCTISNGQGSVTSADAQFTTLAPRSARTDAATEITDLGATLNGLANAGGSSQYLAFEYGPTSAYGTTTSTAATLSTRVDTPVSYRIEALQPSTLYHYRCLLFPYYGAMALTGEDRTFTTAPAATPPEIRGSVTASALTTSTAQLAASSIFAGSSVTRLTFEYGPTPGYGSTIEFPAPIPAATTYSSASANLTGLTPGTTYHFRVTATNTEGVCRSADGTFGTASLPVLATGSASAVGEFQATLAGTAQCDSGTFSLAFQYGATTAYGSTSTATPTAMIGPAATNASVTLAGLEPGSTYHYRIVASVGGQSFYGADRTFTTVDAASPPVFNQTPVAGIIRQAWATLQTSNLWTGSSPTQLVYEYGTTTAYGSMAVLPGLLNANTNPGPNDTDVTLNGLSAGTTYHARCRATNSQGTTLSTDFTFTTTDDGSATSSLTTLAATQVTDTSVVLNASANPGGPYWTASFQYGTTTGYGGSGSTTPNSVSGNSLQALRMELAGLTPNTTYHFRVAAWNPSAGANLYGQDLTFTTQAPVSPPSITGSPTAGTLGTSSALLQVDGVSPGGAEAALVLEYGPTSLLGTVVESGTVPMGSVGVSAECPLNGLLESTKYFYRWRATSSLGVAVTPTLSFTTLAAPAVTTNPATAVNDLGGVLNGSIDFKGTPASLTFEYGTTTAYGNSYYVSGTSELIDGSQAVSATLTGLLPSTTYYYRLGAYVANDDISYFGTMRSFTTTAAATVPALRGNVGANSVTTSRATLVATSVFAGSSAATASFEYGPTSAYGSSGGSTAIPLGTTASSASLALTGLLPDTTYHFRCKVVNTQGTAYSPDGTFTTKALPVLATGPATDIKDIEAVIGGTINPTGNSYLVYFDYGKTTSYGSSHNVLPVSVAGTPVQSASMSLTHLQPLTTYHYRIRAYDSVDSTSFNGSDMQFTTGPAVTPPSFTGLATANVQRASATLTSPLVWAGSSAATVRVEYGLTEAYGTTLTYGSPVALASSNTVSVYPSGLQPMTTYHFRWKATNNQGEALTQDSTFTTLGFPVAVTRPISAISPTSATLNGIINPGGVSCYIYGS